MNTPIFYPLAELHYVVCMIEYERVRNNIENWKKNARECSLVRILRTVRSIYQDELNSKINKICRAIESLQKNGIECSIPVFDSEFLDKLYSICLEEIKNQIIDDKELIPRFKGDALFQNLKKERIKYSNWLFDREISMEKNIELLLDIIVNDKTPSGRSIYKELGYEELGNEINYTKDDYIDDVSSELMMYLEKIECGTISEYDKYYFTDNHKICWTSRCSRPLTARLPGLPCINNRYSSYYILRDGIFAIDDD